MMDRFLVRGAARGLLKLSWNSLAQHRLRSFLSTLGIVCGVAAVVAILSIGEGAKREVLAGIRRLGLENVLLRRISISPNQREQSENQSHGLSIDDVAVLRKATNAIDTVAYLKELQVMIVNSGQRIMPQVVACSSSYLPVQGVHLRSGRLLLPLDEDRKNQVCVLGEKLAGRLGAQGAVGSRIRLDGQLFLVVGVVGESLHSGRYRNGPVQVREIDEMLFLPFGSHRYLSGDENERDPYKEVDEILLHLRDQGEVEDSVPLLHRTLAVLHHGVQDYQLIVPRELLQQAGKTKRILNLVLAAIGGISLLVGGIGIMNVLLVSVAERTREIGVRRAVGATRKDIVAQFLTEAALLTTTGGVCGLIFGLLCSLLIAWLADWSMAVTPFGLLSPLLTSFFIGIAAGLYPAILAARMDPAAALRAV